MKKHIYTIGLTLSLALSGITKAQVTESFDTFTLTPNSFYQDVNGTDWQSSLTSPMVFSYDYSGGAWTGGFAYTNMKDTVDGTAANLYGASTYTAFDGSNYATAQNKAVIRLPNSSNFLNNVSGFFATNTTHVWKTVKNGSAGCRKFGDTTGTFAPDTMLQGEYPDWLKLVVFGYRNGNMVADSVEMYLADYRLPGTQNDYIVTDWRYVNCRKFPYVDSLMMIMRSSDNGITGMNTPGYFSIDRFTTTNAISVPELENISGISMYPNPAGKQLSVSYTAKSDAEVNLTVYDVYGKLILKQQQIALRGNNNIKLETEALESGVYVMELSNGPSSKKIKFIKQ
jgi:hypothetical protein